MLSVGTLSLLGRSWGDHARLVVAWWQRESPIFSNVAWIYPARFETELSLTLKNSKGIERQSHVSNLK